MLNPVLDAILEDRLIVTGNRVLLKAVSVFDVAKKTGGALGAITIAGQRNTEKDVAYFEVLGVGEKVKTVVKGQKVLHVSAAADQVAAEYGIVHEDDIIAILLDK